MFLPRVNWIMIDNAKSPVIIPFERLVDVLGMPLKLIDDCQPLIEPISPEELPDLVARARKFHSSPK
jgi:hypothetical protein